MTDHSEMKTLKVFLGLVGYVSRSGAFDTIGHS